MEQQDQDRSEDATPHKLREARKRGQVAKSTDFVSFVMLSALLVFLMLAAERAIRGMLQLAAALFTRAGHITLAPDNVMVLFGAMESALLAVFGPLLGVLLIAAIVGNFAQTGPVFSAAPLKPDFNRINPVQGAKRFFSLRFLYEIGKTLLKILLFTAIAALMIQHAAPLLMALPGISPRHYAAFLLHETVVLFAMMLLALLIVALLDLLFTQWDYRHRQRMSRREVKDEVRRREGDPRIRAKLRELQREAVKRAASVKRVPEADVIITNPTHLAVALKYSMDEMDAPIVIAKGAGAGAALIRMLARRHRVPMMQDQQLARQLFRRTRIDESVPPALYPAVAKVLVWAFALRDGRLAILEAGA